MNSSRCGTAGSGRSRCCLCFIRDWTSVRSFTKTDVFPRSRFTAKRLADAGIPHDDVERYREAVDCLPNLQLLSGVENVEKQAKLPAEWLANAFPKPEQRATYLRDNDLDGVSLDIGDFLDFYDQRKEKHSGSAC